MALQRNTGSDDDLYNRLYRQDPPGGSLAALATSTGAAPPSVLPSVSTDPIKIGSGPLSSLLRDTTIPVEGANPSRNRFSIQTLAPDVQTTDGSAAGGQTSASTATAGAADDFATQIRALYARYGRTVTDAEIDSHRTNPGGIAAVEEMLSRGAGPDDSHAASGASGARWDANWFTSNIGRPNTVAELVALEPKIVAAGGKLLRNASGVAGKIQTPDGRIVDVMIASGLGGQGFTWDEGGGGGASGGAGIDPEWLRNNNLLEGYDGQFVPSNTPLPDVPVYDAPDLPEFTPWTAPSAADVYKDPSYQLRRDEGARAILNRQSAMRTARTGGALMDLLNYNQNAASQEYANVASRSLSGAQFNRQGQLDQWRASNDAASAEYAPKLAEWQAKINDQNRDDDQQWAQYLQDYKEWYDQQMRVAGLLQWQTGVGLNAAGA